MICFISFSSLSCKDQNDLISVGTGMGVFLMIGGDIGGKSKPHLYWLNGILLSAGKQLWKK